MEVARVGVRKRARSALAMASASSNGIASTPKRRKINDEQLKFSSSSFVQLKSTSPAVIKPESTSVPAAAEAEERCSSPSSDEFPASCCSSNGSIELCEERIKFEDLEVESAQVETSTCNSSDERREMCPPSELRTNSQEVESTEKATEANSRRTTTENKMPTESELEEFFGAAEKEIQKRFVDKYNYDIVKDVALEGRYEWVRLKP
ncbi:hypothetical protein L6164_019923 [Bauhinia variegata]|uniref:Uncharacterized protein n=1 Tax=Bauhinia variegata TaxID=167791 RepID=A0ACB9MTP2_BAUVA|nr:hypothetical protein L6164_019923 [Bauhinia variegata]